STYVVGYYQTETEAAIAYNKAVDELTKHGIHRKYLLNYVTDISPLEYAELYISIEFSKAFQKTLTNLTIHNNNVHT
ncbi:MAG: hypothetical protein GX567_17475, partial [Clostridia bacterium]|nr:hypothetical protein [Clostridia bacterium]